MTKIGIIGAGPNAAGHARYYKSCPRAQLVAIADPDMDRARKLAEECEAKAVAQFDSFLPDVDAVVVSSPNFLHREHAVACAQAGRHVFCEKPMGLNLVEAFEIANAIRDANVQSAIGFSVRLDPQVRTMTRLARDGSLGEVISICSRRLMCIGEGGADWRRDPKRSGGLLLEINIHELDWMLCLGGKVRSLFARKWAADKTNPRANDHVWIAIDFESGPTGLHEGSWVAPVAQYYRSVVGTEAGLCTNEWGNELFHATRGAQRQAYPSDPAFDLRGHFLDTIQEGVPPQADAHAALEVMTVAEAVLESANSGLPVFPAAIADSVRSQIS